MYNIDDDIESLLETAATLSDLSDLNLALLDCFKMVSRALSVHIEKIFPNSQAIRVMELATSISAQFSSIADHVSWGQPAENINPQIEPNLVILQRLVIEIHRWLKGMIFQIERIQEKSK